VSALDGHQPFLAVLAVLAGAAITALGTALQQRATHAVPGGGAGMRLMLSLARKPAWLGSLGLIAVGFCCYLVALAAGTLTLAQPIMISGLVFGSYFSARLAGRRSDPRLLLGAAICGGALALLLGVAQPGGAGPGRESVGAAAGLWLAALFGVALAGAAVVAVRGRGLPRALALASATGILFGVNAALTKMVVGQLAHRWMEPLGHWHLYAMVFVAPAGLVLSQRAMQLSGTLAPVNAVISAVDPLTAVTIGLVLLGERVNTTPLAVLTEVVACLALFCGIGMVARRGAQLNEAHRAAVAGRDRAALSWG
jgi:drug/metabolite transporter (DMT)-like permease